MKIYLAGPIFTYGDLLRNTEWAEKIRAALPGVDLYSPVENTDINGVEGKKKFAGSKEIAKGDNDRLNVTDVLVACIDGDVLPSGTCAEIGKFHEKIERGDHKHIIGICTDNRQCFLTASDAKDAGKVIDATYGRKTRAVIFMDSGQIILTSVQPETVSARIQGKPKAGEDADG